MFRVVPIVLVLGLLPAYANAQALPGQEIRVQAVVMCADSAGLQHPAEQSNTVRTLVAPPDNAAVYFTTIRSIFLGPSLLGRCIKLAGAVASTNGRLFISDGSAIPSMDRTGSPSARVELRTDLINVDVPVGSFVCVQGVVSVADDGQVGLLPFSNSAVTRFL